MVLPVILAGPIVKAATATCVRIWIATSVDLFNLSRSFGPGVSICATVSKRGPDGDSTLLGQTVIFDKVNPSIQHYSPRTSNLHIFVFDIVPLSLRFPAGLALYWDIAKIAAESSDAPSSVTKSESILPDSGGSSTLRRFKIVSEGDATTVWAGSCNRLHGPQSSIFGEMQKVCERSSPPDVMFQLGDQIYADDVSFLLFERVKIVSKLLFETSLTEDEERILALSDVGRKELLRPIYPAFKQDESVCNQLLTLPEFCAYTLLHFNVELWGDLDELAVAAKRNSPEVSITRIRTEVERLSRSRTELASYITVLQSTVVYSLADDHEICDDFFLDVDWGERIYSPGSGAEAASKVAQRAICAAYTAYALFQDVGCSTAGKHLLKTVGANEELELAALEKYQWTYIPSVQFPAVALDTRLSRMFIDSEGFSLSRTTLYRNAAGRFWAKNGSYRSDLRADRVQLAPATQMFRRRELRSSLRDLGQPRIVLFTPSPVISARAFDELKLSFDSREDARYEVDAEGWKSNLSNFANLVYCLIDEGVSEVTAFGGDIHFAYFKQSEIRRSVAGRYSGLLFNQITTSPQMNGYERTFGKGTVPLQRVLLNFVSRSDNGYSAFVPIFDHSGVSSWIEYKDESFKSDVTTQYIEEIVANGGLFLDADKSNTVKCNFSSAVINADGTLKSFGLVSNG